MQRKPGGYRKPTDKQRRESKINKKDFAEWFQQVWKIPGASTKNHPAPFPLELANRLVQMFSFTGDTVLDPFCGTGTTLVAALKNRRNSIGIEIDPEYCGMARDYLNAEGGDIFANAKLFFELAAPENLESAVRESSGKYKRNESRKRSQQ